MLRSRSNRPAARDNVREWQEYKRRIWTRSDGRCEVPGCVELAQDGHHVVKPRRSNHRFAIAVCRHHHELVDAPLDRGRLVIRLLDRTPTTLRFRFAKPMLGWEREVILAAI